MDQSMVRAFAGNFLGNAPLWYKKTIIGFLILNPILFYMAGPFVAGWALIAEFIFALAMALKGYPLQPCHRGYRDRNGIARNRVHGG